ncbi:Exonuclease III [Sinosporangium album]|uniref:Exonuclease III n=1 Tax=Sinosporangium album TaxID=504805 RepID=A0A1G7TGK1_9ACTN|nr:endonuclease/exonuclease/phosphatase family protein [Sinosporangium album]SDG34375.1 Exonuclease III [Sinosporangium album]
MRRIPLISAAALAAITATASLAVADPAGARASAATPAASGTPSPQGASTAAAPGGTLTVKSAVVQAGRPITFTYTTTALDAKNWIGLYTDPGNGPVDQRYVGPSLTWAYTPHGNGTVELPTTGLEPGNYIAFSLAKDGYKWLAEPVKLRVTSGERLRFVTETIPLRNARAESAYSATVQGLLRGDTDGMAFQKVSGPSWVKVDARGAVTGTPPAAESATTSVVEVRAANAAGDSRTAKLSIDVRPPGARLVPELKALSWNLWHGGSQVKGGREKQLKFLLDHDIDVVGLQESSGVSAAELAAALGWDHYQAGADVGVISRYPIVSRGPLPSVSGLPVSNVTIELDERHGEKIALWNAHLGYTPYGPYDACFGKMTVQQLLDREAQSKRTGQIEGIMRAMESDLRAADRTPVLLMGDFNAPSHLDWTAANSRCGYRDVPWPTSVLPERAGMKDSYRVANPDPKAAPGITWSPIYKTFTGGYGHDSHKGEPEPLDRIDFIHYKGNMRVKSSAAVVEGVPTAIPDHQNNQWTSDHAAVLTVFDVP